MTRKILLEKIDIPNIKEYDVYRKNGRYSSVEKLLKSMNPEEIVKEVKTSGLRGRRGAGFPVDMKWGFIDKKSGNPRHLLVNAYELESGTFKDRYLMERMPHLLIESHCSQLCH